MFNKNYIIGSIVIFIIVYIILYIDRKLNKRCDYEECYINNNISIKAPILITIITLIIYKMSESYIYSYYNGFSIVKQDIITEMADF